MAKIDETKLIKIIEDGKSTEEITKKLDIKLQTLRNKVSRLLYFEKISTMPFGLFEEAKPKDTVKFVKAGIRVHFISKRYIIYNPRLSFIIKDEL
jgi:hypothetical protein